MTFDINIRIDNTSSTKFIKKYEKSWIRIPNWKLEFIKIVLETLSITLSYNVEIWAIKEADVLPLSVEFHSLWNSTAPF